VTDYGNIGQANPSAKLTEEDVRVIRSRIAICRANRTTAIARDYGVSVGTINEIANRRTWAHVE
jgi:hypothetical protein